MSNCEQSVKNGIKYLRIVCPLLIPKIDAFKLDMSNTRECVLGQLYGNYHEGVRKLNLRWEDIVFFGFNIDETCNYTIKDLSNEWVVELCLPTK